VEHRGYGDPPAFSLARLALTALALSAGWGELDLQFQSIKLE